MTPGEWALLFTGIGVVLLIAELFIPSHAMLTVAAAVAFMIAVGFCFAISPVAGFYAGMGMVIVTPVVLFGFLKLWPRTFIGRRMTLANVTSSGSTAPAPVGHGLLVGSRGLAITELRPTGVCEFGGERVEAVSDRGIVARDMAVVVVALQEGRPVVRAESASSFT